MVDYSDFYANLARQQSTQQSQDRAGWAGSATGRQSTYGSGLGTVNLYGAANPLGPYSGLGRAGAGGGSSSSTSGNADAEAWLKNVMAGNNLPFSPQQQAAMLTQQSDMGAAAEGARNNQLDANAAASGSSGRDPSLQGAKAANFAARQVGNQRAAGNIASQANSANFGAQQDAANTLNNNSMQRAQWAQSASNGAQAFLPWNQPANQTAGRQSTFVSGIPTGSPQSQANPWQTRSSSTPSQTTLAYRNTQAWQDDYNRSMQNDQYYEDMGL